MNYLCHRTGLAALLSIITLQGCAQNQSFLPPTDGERIHFTATIPQELVSSPIYAVYRSEVCRKENRTSNMEVYTVPGYHREQYPLTMNASNQVDADIPKSGGGKCDWKLSNFVFEVTLKDPSKIDPLISDNLGKKVSFVLDNNSPATFDGGYEKKSGDFNETLLFFPLLTKNYLDGYEGTFYLIGKNDPLTYKITNAKRVNINVNYKKQYLSVWTGRLNNNRPFMTYPNGDIVYGEVRPQYKKLLKISESMSSK
ncbi:hypothetical protein [Providencia hangzhouensis]